MLATFPNRAVAERIQSFVDAYSDDNLSADFRSRREHPRHTMKEPVDIMIDSSETPARMVLATGRDISCGGIGLYFHEAVSPGTRMLLNIDNGRQKLLAKAIAVHSTLSVGMYKVGARFIV